MTEQFKLGVHPPIRASGDSCTQLIKLETEIKPNLLVLKLRQVGCETAKSPKL